MNDTTNTNDDNTPVNSMSEEEIQWALQIKSTVQDDEELMELSDFDYAAFAIHTRGDIELALHKIRGLQEFRKEYKVRDIVHEHQQPQHPDEGDDDDDDDATVREAMDCLKAYMDQMPWLILDVEHDTQLGHHVLVLDYAKLDPNVCRMPEDWRIQLAGLYFLHHCVQPNLFSIRQGIIRICELDGLSWKNFKVDFFRTTYHHLIEYFPIQHKEMSWVHSSVIGNMIHSLFKMINKPMATKIHLGCPFEDTDDEDGRIDRIFKQPTEQIAQERLLHKMKRFLQERQSNRKHFRLQDLLLDGSEVEVEAEAAEEDDEDEDFDEDDDDSIFSDEEEGILTEDEEGILADDDEEL